MTNKINVTARMLEKIEVSETGCLLWKGAKNTHPVFGGYARISINGKSRAVHRIMYEHINGPIPKGLEIDHLCRVRHCVNPRHLEAVTHVENIRRGVSPSAANSRKTHCKRGHEFTEQNTYRQTTWTKGRACRTCEKARKHGTLKT